MCFLEICFCFFDRFTVQKYQTAFYTVWRLLCKLVGIPPPSFGSVDQRPVSFLDNHYARLKAAAEKTGKEDIADLYLQMNSQSTQ
jgi:hypothetical protein